jgi:hypothetical protein
MRTILIAQRDVIFAERLATELRKGGYRIIVCPGPPPPQRCIRCDKGYCPLTEGADLMIYDPRLTTVDSDGRVHRLAADSATAHPDVPVLLAWSAASAPDLGTLRAIRAEAPNVCVAEEAPADLLRQIGKLLTPAEVTL